MVRLLWKLALWWRNSKTDCKKRGKRKTLLARAITNEKERKKQTKFKWTKEGCEPGWLNIEHISPSSSSTKPGFPFFRLIYAFFKLFSGCRVSKVGRKLNGGKRTTLAARSPVAGVDRLLIVFCSESDANVCREKDGGRGWGSGSCICINGLLIFHTHISLGYCTFVLRLPRRKGFEHIFFLLFTFLGKKTRDERAHEAR